MSLHGLLDVVVNDPALAEAIKAAADGNRPRLDLVGPPAARPFAVAALARSAGRPVLAVTATGREAEDLAAALRSLLPPDGVAEYPSWETLPHERLSPRSDTVGRRLAVLRRLAHPSADDPAAGPVSVVVAPIRSVLQPQVKGLGDLEPVSLRTGRQADLEEVVDRLAAAAYSRVELVEKRGEFAVRGGILDVFPPTEEHPLRIEFWGDDVEEIRYFKVADQRSLEVAEHGLWAPPCRELLLTDDVRQRAAALAEQHPQLGELLGKIAEGIAVEGMESLAPVLVDEMELLLDVLPAGSMAVVCDPERVRTRAADLVATSQEFLQASWAAGAGGGAAPIDVGAASLWGIADVRDRARELGMSWWSVSPFAAAATSADASPEELGEDTLRLGMQAPESYRGDTARALADTKGWIADGWRTVFVTEGHGPAARTVEVLGGEGIPARLAASDGHRGDLAEISPSIVHVACGSIDYGFVDPALEIAVLTETDLSGQKAAGKDAARMPARRRKTIDPLTLQAGDYIVHEQHGVGRYLEMVQRTVQGATREYLLVEYAPAKRGQPGDRLYIPTDQLEQVTKYVGGEAPTLHRLGGADWTKTKQRAKKAVKEIAADLIKLYSARMAAPGHAFGPDTPWQRELEDAFPYVETPDQLTTIAEVKEDMQKSVPMDRLICGDVGYGKTEIAVRAAFKAVQDGKQVAVLVPTTLLVQQHFGTFSERYGQFPVVVKALSRFQSDTAAAAVVEGLRDGSVDIVIGTHRLFSGQTTFKDLGLVIVDEEQRFGVEHKEQLKKLRADVDVLTMSATPIPRTLEMAVTGIREMSTITTPPEERHPVLTFVGPYEEKQIGAAIRRELLREGQVFYIHNRVDSIDRAAARLRAIVPEARIATAHGQMSESLLEQVVVDFWEKEYDVLVSTTIVESGIDISNANTLIVERGDNFGLSQLHQLRGRVGRGRERGYAYFLYPPEKPLTETAHERLATIAQHTEMGAGMYVAMKDLEIRGAGNLLGGEQSGHIAGVGFDLYVRMVGEAVADYRASLEGGVQEEPPLEVKIELPVDAHVPHDYAPGERLRLQAYRAIAAANSEQDVADVREELTDRYGKLPEPVENLLLVAGLRLLARACGVSDITLQGSNVRFSPVELRESQELRLRRLHPRAILKPATRQVLVPRPATARIGGKPLVGRELLSWTGEFLTTILDS
ncbi:transcription-repair coupling factor [Streptomyces sp. KR80]|uniref:transcription-repair coupling factor n=1 Tax=Streptomyces sp. KR80 TaxID=3457426 RepID=UPI003FD5A310